MTGKNNNIYIRGIGGGRSPLQVKSGSLEGSYQNTFKVQTGAFLKYALGAVTGSGTVGSPYAYSVADTPASLTIEKAYNTPTTANTMRLTGALCQNASIKYEERQPVLASTQFIGKTFAKGSTYQTITPATTDVYMAYNATLEMPSGSVIAQIPGAELSILNHAENYYEIGSRFGTGVFKEREFLGTIRPRVIDGYWMDKFLTGGTGATAPIAGTPAEVATLKLNLTNGTKYIYLNFASVFVDDWNGTLEQGQLAESEIPIRALGCTATEVV